MAGNVLEILVSVNSPVQDIIEFQITNVEKVKLHGNIKPQRQREGIEIDTEKERIKQDKAKQRRPEKDQEGSVYPLIKNNGSYQSKTLFSTKL